MKLRLSILVLAGALFVSACGESHTSGEDAAIVFDATFPDTGVDAGPPPSNVGEPCRGDMDCDEPAGTCVDLPGGYCTAICSGGEECPADSECVVVDRMGTAICLASCDPASSEDQCRAGYGCGATMGTPPVCLPGCEEDSDCGEGRMCDVGGGPSGAGQCFDPESSTGDACESEGECPAGGFCLPERFGFPGGYCAQFGCDAEADTGCEAGDHCFPTRGGGICFAGCETDDDCTREDYDCQDSLDFPGRMTCQPAFEDANLGGVCSAGRGDCTGGACLSESETGWPDSTCVATGCDPEAAEPDCPGDGVCIPAGDSGLCVDGCETGGDCRDGYDCRPSDPEDDTSATACLPGCDDSSVCGNDGFECNPGTGLCTEPFDEANLGEPCVDGEDCVGGRCLDEEDTGWPAGTCTYPGCRLSGDGREAECPTGSACVDDASGDPELGVCVASCTVDADPSTCRPAYVCVEVSAGSTEGTCQPTCTSGDCGAGRTCNTETGLCE